MKFLLFILIPIALFSCKKFEDGYRIFTIKEGKHYSKHGIESSKVNSLKFEAIFDESAMYSTIDSINQFDFNKLYGLSDGSGHHDNSARFGWRWLNDSIQIFTYVYNDGIRTHHQIGSVLPNELHTYSLTIEENQYKFTLFCDYYLSARRAVFKALLNIKEIHVNLP